MRILAVTGGHSFDRDAFALFLDSLPCDVQWIEQPAALDFLAGPEADAFDVSLHYDMPGARPEPVSPPAAFAEAIASRTRSGHGFVVLHHALASWPAWPDWAEMVGGRYLYRPGELRGQAWPDSGFRHEVPQHLSPASPAAAAHPVLDGLGEGLDVVDETYLCPVFEDDVEPLLRTDAPIDPSVHTSTLTATHGRDPGAWEHPAGSTLAAWTRTVGSSRLVYVQPGDTARTLGDPAYRRLVANAIGWVSPSR